MLHRLKLHILVQGLTLFLVGPACDASSLGLTVHVVPLDSDGGKTVRAHFTAIASTPCPDLSHVCAEGEDCLVYKTPLPFIGTKPSDWCVRQWQKTLPSIYSGSISLGEDTEFYVAMKAGPEVRKNSGRLNQPAFVGLPPPLRARVNCPHHFSLSVKDLDGDRVRCRFARPDQGECVGCTRHSFIELDEDTCMLTFTGKASVGQYFIYLMAEDLIPGPKGSRVFDNTPLSSIPVHLSLTVEESVSSCTDEPVAYSETPDEDTTLFVLPYHEIPVNVSFYSALESVLEIAVVGPPELKRKNFKSIGPLSALNMAWVRSENELPRLLPICFAANTKSLQSEPRCVWLYQRQMRELPAGTELTCEKTEMILVLPVAPLSNIDLDELQLNSPICPITYNSTYLTAHIPLDGCGTKTVHADSELIYTNTLQSVRPFTMVSRQPSLVLPLACRIPSGQVKGPQYEIKMPTEKEIFGEFSFEMEFHFPGEGPFANFTRTARLRSLDRARRFRREVESSSNSTTNSTDHNGSKISLLDLVVSANCSISGAELVVSQCVQSETDDFAEQTPILHHGCLSSNNSAEVITTNPNVRIYRLDLSTVHNTNSMMYVQCTVNLCITTLSSHTCPELCGASRESGQSIVESVFTKSYIITSPPVSLVYTTPVPLVGQSTVVATSTMTTASSSTNTSASENSSSSHAPEHTSSMAAGVILTTLSIFLHNIFLH
ncbi:hypothetical protein JOB18_003414 [Solea senegalensis]|uniref:ZP domain-containing protein n=1 Tax=Solea senegalensis TaxID=28829 RepID=A0AAV6Q2J2_SOLSE|nr:uncharacterized protein LOC122772497 [Solea senegalensis]KAG7481727.1 hypothetical protein JOB18_003414 [Solea senegalensis]